MFKAHRYKIIITAWLLAILGGFILLERYSNKQGAPALARIQWPKTSGIALAPDRPTLVLFAHPRCPCSAATLSELQVLLHDVKTTPALRIQFYSPSNKNEAWAKTRLWENAQHLKASVSLDPDGKEAQIFGARTSGQTFLYNPAGELLFSGGITGARGHAGENAGRRNLATAIETGKAAEPGSPVFGCALLHDEHLSVNFLEEETKEVKNAHE